MAAPDDTVSETVEDGLPTVVCAVVMPLAKLSFVPMALEVMSTVTVQFPLAGMVMPLKLRLVSPLLKLLVLAPAQVPPADCTPEICMLVN